MLSAFEIYFRGPTVAAPKIPEIARKMKYEYCSGKNEMIKLVIPRPGLSER